MPRWWNSNANAYSDHHTTSISYANSDSNDHTTSVSYAYSDDDATIPSATANTDAKATAYAISSSDAVNEWAKG